MLLSKIILQLQITSTRLLYIEALNTIPHPSFDDPTAAPLLHLYKEHFYSPRLLTMSEDAVRIEKKF